MLVSVIQEKLMVLEIELAFALTHYKGGQAAGGGGGRFRGWEMAICRYMHIQCMTCS